MFQRMKNKLFLRAVPDTNPNCMSLRPPAGSQIHSKYTREQTGGEHRVLKTSWRFLKLRRWQRFSIPRPGECPLEAFLYKTGFSCWLPHSRTAWVGQEEARKERSKKQSAGEGPFTPSDEFPKNLPSLYLTAAQI